MPALSILIASMLPAFGGLPLDADRWLPVLVEGAPVTDIAELSSGYRAMDLVGDPDSPAAYWSLDPTSVYFRFRLARSPLDDSLFSPFNCLPYTCTWAVLVNGDEDLGTFDQMVVLNNSALTIELWSNPEEPGWRSPVGTLEESITAGYPGENVAVTDTETSFSGEDNAFVDIKIPRSWLGLSTYEALVQIVMISGEGFAYEGLRADIASTAAADDLSASWSLPIGTDGDGDGLHLTDELAMGADPQNDDTDDDGLSDGDEVWVHGTDPTLSDSDTDGLSDYDEIFSYFTFPTDPDSDDDGLLDGDEVMLYGTDPLDPTDPDPSVDVDCDALPDAIDSDIDLLSDPDADGLDITHELACGTDPCSQDFDVDGDGISNTLELSSGTDPCDSESPDTSIDLDCDEIPDWEDPEIKFETVDVDGDGIANTDEPACGGDPCVPELDIDGDGLSNASEQGFETDPCDAADPDPELDADCDGIPDYLDDFIAFDPDADNDGDQIPNGVEVEACDTDPCSPNEDPDEDGVSNATELECGTDPCAPDSDADGLWDGEELGEFDCGQDTDNDGIIDALDPDGLRVDDPLNDPDAQSHGFVGGQFTGGGCNQGAGPASALMMLFGLFLCLSRRGIGVAILLLAPMTLHAESINADHLQSAINTRSLMGVTDPVESNSGGLGGILIHHARNPLLYRKSGGDDIRVLGNLWSSEFSGGYTFGRHTVGVQAPIHLYAAGDFEPKSGLMGDLRMTGSAVFIDRRDGPIGLGMSSHITLPTGTPRYWLSQGTTSGAASLDMSVGDQIVGAINLGFRAMGTTELDGLKLGSAARWTAGLLVPATERIWTSIELDGTHYVNAIGHRGGNPIEVRGFGRFALTKTWLFSMGAGTAMSAGVGAPTLRLMAGLSTAPQTKARAPNPTATPTPHQVASSAPIVADQVLIRISVTDANGEPLVANVWLMQTDTKAHTNADGIALLTPPGGENTLHVSSDGYASIRRTVNLDPGKETALVLVLAPARVAITADRLIIEDKIFFETGSTIVAPSSHGLLDEVALLLLDHPELNLVQVQGHTDDVGEAQANLELSNQRAQAVVNYLIAAGLSPNRLEAIGYGEDRPLTPDISTSARAKNRRVEFHVLKGSMN